MKRKKIATLLQSLLALLLAEVAQSANFQQARHHPMQLNQLPGQPRHTSAHRFQASAFSQPEDDRVFRRKQSLVGLDSEGESVQFSPMQSSGDSADRLSDSSQLSSSAEMSSSSAGPVESSFFDSIPTRLGSSDASGGLQNSPSSSSYETELDSSSAGGQNEPFSRSNSNKQALDRHNSQLQAMQEMFERRQLAQAQTGSGNEPGQTTAEQSSQPELESSQELSPISIGLDPSSPFSMAPFSLGVNAGGDRSEGPLPARGPLASADEQPGLGLSFGLNQLPQLLGFQSPPSAFGVPPPPGEGPPQRGDPMPLHHGSSAAASGDPDSGPQTGPNGQKVYPKIFRFTDGRINLSDFEKQKKIRLSNKNQLGDNHIESAPIMFDGRQLKRKSFLILHGGIFSRRR